MSIFELPELPYALDALEPHMSRETLELHHGKHHRGYVDKTNKLLEKSEIKDHYLEDVVRKSHGADQDLFNNAAQHYNHTHFWQWMTPKGGGAVPEKLQRALADGFGSIDGFKDEFKKAGTGQFGSGWVWLMWQAGQVRILATPNGENPLVHGGQPLLGCDVWEHAYYLDHKNERGKYLEAFLDNLVDWQRVEALFDEVS